MLQNSEINIAQQNGDVTVMQIFNASTVKFMERNKMTGSIGRLCFGSLKIICATCGKAARCC